MTRKMQTYMTEADWESHYPPLTPHGGDCLLFEIGDADAERFIEKLGNQHVWTQVGYEDELFYLPGRRRMNCEGYIITLRPWAEEKADLIVRLDD